MIAAILLNLQPVWHGAGGGAGGGYTTTGARRVTSTGDVRVIGYGVTQDAGGSGGGGAASGASGASGERLPASLLQAIAQANEAAREKDRQQPQPVEANAPAPNEAAEQARNNRNRAAILIALLMD